MEHAYVHVGSVVLGVLGLVLACSEGKSSGSSDEEGTGGSGVVIEADPRCPTTMPIDGRGCSINGADCPYGSTLCSCEGSTWICEFGAINTPPGGVGGGSSTTNQATTNSPLDDCPYRAPQDGASCYGNVGAQDCTYDSVVCDCLGRRGNAQWECIDTGGGTGGDGGGGAGVTGGGVEQGGAGGLLPTGGGVAPTGGSAGGGLPPTGGGAEPAGGEPGQGGAAGRGGAPSTPAAGRGPGGSVTDEGGGPTATAGQGGEDV